MEETERQALVLTKKQRQFLLGELDLEGAYRRSMRSKIRKRIAGSIRDFNRAILLSQDDIQDCVEEAGAVVPLIEFAFLASGGDTDRFEGLVETAVSQGLLEGDDVSFADIPDFVKVDIEVAPRFPIEEIKDRYESGGELFPEEIGLLVSAFGSDSIDPDQLAEQSSVREFFEDKTLDDF